MFATLVSLLLVLAVLLLWLDGARAREIATAVVDELCRRRGFQLLDETVALTRFGITHGHGGLRIRRLFQYDYSVEGMGRQQGHILLHGTRVMRVDLAEAEPGQASSAEGQGGDKDPAERADNSDNVVPFRRRH